MGAAAFVLNETGIRGIRLDDAAKVSDGIAAALAHNGPAWLFSSAERSSLCSRRDCAEAGRPVGKRLTVCSCFPYPTCSCCGLGEQQRQSVVTRGVRPRISAAPLPAEFLARSIQAARCPVSVTLGEA
jgi:hypothetical protein